MSCYLKSCGDKNLLGGGHFWEETEYMGEELPKILLSCLSGSDGVWGGVVGVGHTALE